MKLSDYVARFLAQRGIRDIFLVSGGGIMHLLDSVGRNADLRYWCNYHEQACAIAAEGYTRVTGTIGACLVTVGPGAVNALAGIVGAWYDSLPMLVLSGQVRRDIIADYTKIRQFGPQEGNVTAMAAPVTKYAKTIMDPATIRYELEKALHLATTGRPGPVWIEIPLDVQGSQIDETMLVGYTPPEAEPKAAAKARLVEDVRKVVELLKNSKRPLLMPGNGVHAARVEHLLLQAAEKLQIPVVLNPLAKDLIPEAHPMNQGIFSSNGQRRANFAVQNCDCYLSLASGLAVTKTGFNYKGFAPKAKKVIVDIDEGQLYHQVIKADIPVLADVGEFLEELLRQAVPAGVKSSPKWLEACAKWKQRYPLILPEYFADTKHVNSYVFIDKLSDVLKGDEVVVAGNGLDTVSYYQVFKVKPGQRTFTSGNWGSMGWDLPLTVGSSIAGGKRTAVCVTGDGSIQWNIQELLTIKQYQLPVKIFIFNNQGYSSIRATQKNLMEGRIYAADANSGVGNPDFAKLAAAYSLGYARIDTNDQITAVATQVMATPGGVLCEVNISTEQGITPKASAFKRPDGTLESRPLEDMAPFLPREEIHENMHMFDDDA